MLSTEEKIRRGFHWLAVFVAAILLALGLPLAGLEVIDFWRGGGDEELSLLSIGDLFLGALGLFIACMAAWAMVRAVGWIAVRLYRILARQPPP